jgi:hypothetical protein
MARPDRRPAIPTSSLFLVATDVAGRVSLLAGPYPTLAEAAARVRPVVERLAGAPALAGFGHVTVAEGAVGSATFFGHA